MVKSGGWRVGSVVNNTLCSPRGPTIDFQYQHGGSQPSVTVVLKNLVSVLTISGTRHAHWCTDIHIGKMPKHKWKCFKENSVKLKKTRQLEQNGKFRIVADKSTR
ncbi:hypothetical protein ACRRTK_009564 [Alexandromys fortis]